MKMVKYGQHGTFDYKQSGCLRVCDSSMPVIREWHFLCVHHFYFFLTLFVSERKKINSGVHLVGKLFCTSGLLYQKAQLIDLVGSSAAGSHSQTISVRKRLVPEPAGALHSEHVTKGWEKKTSLLPLMLLFSRQQFHFHCTTKMTWIDGLFQIKSCNVVSMWLFKFAFVHLANFFQLGWTLTTKLLADGERWYYIPHNLSLHILLVVQNHTQCHRYICSLSWSAIISFV